MKYLNYEADYYESDTMEWVHVKGIHRGDVYLYALSTCGHCKRTKELLNSLGVEYQYVFVDTLPDDEIPTVLKAVEKYNPGVSFPTLIIDNGKRCIVGYHKEEIIEALSE